MHIHSLSVGTSYLPLRLNIRNLLYLLSAHVPTPEWKIFRILIETVRLKSDYQNCLGVMFVLTTLETQSWHQGQASL